MASLIRSIRPKQFDYRGAFDKCPRMGNERRNMYIERRQHVHGVPAKTVRQPYSLGAQNGGGAPRVFHKIKELGWQSTRQT